MTIETLKSDHEFDMVFNEGKRISGKLLNVLVREVPGKTRIGIIVNSKYGGAVERNRTRRQIKEALNQLVDKFKGFKEIVVIPRHGAKNAKTEEIKAALSDILARI